MEVGRLLRNSWMPPGVLRPLSILPAFGWGSVGGAIKLNHKQCILRGLARPVDEGTAKNTALPPWMGGPVYGHELPSRQGNTWNYEEV